MKKKSVCLNEFKYDNVINSNEIKDISLEKKNNFSGDRLFF